MNARQQDQHATRAHAHTTLELKQAMQGHPWLHQEQLEVQAYESVREVASAISEDSRMHSCRRLNQLLADTQVLYSLYKKHQWLTGEATKHQLDLVFAKYAGEPLASTDSIAKRIHCLGGVPISDPRHIAEITCIPRPPDGCEDVPAMLSRSLEALELILVDAHESADGAKAMGDDETSGFIVSNVMRTNEMQAWFLAEHLAGMSVTKKQTHRDGEQSRLQP